MADPIDYTKTRALHSGQEEKEERQIREFTLAIDRVRQEYQLYFNGVVTKPPYGERNQLDNLARWNRHNPPKRTAQRFKMQQVMAKYQNMAEHWDRSLRGLEEGTEMPWVPISRRYHSKEDVEPVPAAAAADQDAAAERAASGNGTQASSYLAALRDPSGQEEDVRKIYNSYMAARNKVGAETASLSFEKFSEVVAKQTSTIIARGASAVQFRIEISDDKVHLKAKAVRDED